MPAAPEVFRHSFQGPFDPLFGGSPYVNDTSKILLIELVTGRAADNALEVRLTVQDLQNGTGEAHFYQFPTRTLLPPPSNTIPGAIETFVLPVHELTRIYVLPGESLIPLLGSVIEVSGQFLP